MKKYLLDTNICVHFLRGKHNLDVKFRQIGLENCFISEITLLELEYGVENSDVAYQAQQRASLQTLVANFNGRILPIWDCFSLYATNRVRLRKLGTPISDFDMLIGCTSLSYSLVMVTENIAEFVRIENIQVENWVAKV